MKASIITYRFPSGTSYRPAMRPLTLLRPEGPAAVGKRRRAVGRSIRKLRREWTALFGDLNDPFTWLKIGA